MNSSQETHLINRLRELDERDRAQTARIGKFAGRRWARRTATPAELDRLAKTKDTKPGFGEEPHVRLVEIVRPASAYSHEEIEVFWQDLLGLDDVNIILQSAFVAGFVEGAIATWQRVAARVRSAA